MDPRNVNLGLHERRRRRDHNDPVNFSQIRRPRPLETDLPRHFAHNAAQMTPPETPLSPFDVTSTLEPEQPALFHNYLRAFYHFNKETRLENREDALLMTASIRPGDLILVHSVHTNGWADGTVLTTGARGWLPTNYCESFDHPYLRNLLNAMTQFWDLLGDGEDANLSTFVRQDYIRGLIAGVRYLLEHADCLHRDAALVQRNTGIRRIRKGLLADLSSLVQLAKRLQETIGEPFAPDVIQVLLEELIAKAFRVVTRAVSFVDIWTSETTSTKRLQVKKPAGHEPVTPPGDNGEPAQDISASRVQRSTHEPAKHRHSSSIHSSTQHPRFSFPQDTCIEKQLSGAIRPASGVLTHRVSLVKDRPQQSTLASHHLAEAHDVCISQIGGFIGLHLHSRPSSELFSTTERLNNTCTSLLAVVDQVYSNDPNDTPMVKQSREECQQKLDQLILSTKDVFQFSDSPDDDFVMLPEQSLQFINVGTELIRAVGDCVVKTRHLIESIGDFDLPKSAAVDPGRSSICGSMCASTEHDFTEAQSRASVETRISQKALPPVPPLTVHRPMDSTDVTDFAASSGPAERVDELSPCTTPESNLQKSLPLPPRVSSIQPSPTTTTPPERDGSKPPRSAGKDEAPARECSVGTSISSSANTHQSSMRDSAATEVSELSTRATTPDHNAPDPGLINSFASLSSLRSAATTDVSIDAESQLLQKTYASELTLNKDGQVTGGSLPALVEQLTTHDNAPDPQFVKAFFLTFRSFTSARELAQELTHRFDYIGDSKAVGTPVRLRICNIFKGWLETYWNVDADKEALGDIRFFALHKLKPQVCAAGDRLLELVRRVTAAYANGNFTGPLVSGVGKTSMSIGPQSENAGSFPDPIISKSQLNALRAAGPRNTTCNIGDFDPLELARQLTIHASNIFCEISADELLSLDWNRKTTTRARNVRAMCIMNTDLAHVVGDTILTPDDAKKRAAVIKHWAKVATHCLELNNFECVMAIMCSLNSSVVRRLKRTWETVSKKTRARLEVLDELVDFSRNQAALRRRLEQPSAPCVPFLGIYLTDLTFVDAGNPKTRELPGTARSDAPMCDASPPEPPPPVSVVNFDKHMRMARVLTHLQQFQVPYRLHAVPELQEWLQGHLARMREVSAEMVGRLHRRSMLVEPRQGPGDAGAAAAAAVVGGRGEGVTSGAVSALERRKSEVGLQPAAAGAEDRPKTAQGGAKGKAEAIEQWSFLIRSPWHLKGN